MTIDVGTMAFLEKLNADRALQSELETALADATDKTTAAVAFALSKGHQIDRVGFDEARAALAAAAAASGAMDEAELEAVAGGFNPQPEPPARISKLYSSLNFKSTLLSW